VKHPWGVQVARCTLYVDTEKGGDLFEGSVVNKRKSTRNDRAGEKKKKTLGRLPKPREKKKKKEPREGQETKVRRNSLKKKKLQAGQEKNSLKRGDTSQTCHG